MTVEHILENKIPNCFTIKTIIISVLHVFSIKAGEATRSPILQHQCKHFLASQIWCSFYHNHKIIINIIIINIPLRVQWSSPIMTMSTNTTPSAELLWSLKTFTRTSVEFNWMVSKNFLGEHIDPNGKTCLFFFFVFKNLKYWLSCSLCCLHPQTPCHQQPRFGSGHRHRSRTPALLHAPLLTDRKKQKGAGTANGLVQDANRIISFIIAAFQWYTRAEN